MKITLPLRKANCDDDKINIDDFKKCQLYVFESTWDLLVFEGRGELIEDGDTLFSLFVEYGEDLDKALMFNITMDELELFSTAILKKLELVRKNFSKQIQKHYDEGVEI